MQLSYHRMLIKKLSQSRAFTVIAKSVSGAIDHVPQPCDGIQDVGNDDGSSHYGTRNCDDIHNDDIHNMDVHTFCGDNNDADVRRSQL